MNPITILLCFIYFIYSNSLAMYSYLYTDTVTASLVLLQYTVSICFVQADNTLRESL